ncbi:zinc-ribbon domain-containing protein [Enterococcus sp. 22-H-5-01]
MNYCPNCGTELRAGAKFCPACRCDLEQETRNHETTDTSQF